MISLSLLLRLWSSDEERKIVIPSVNSFQFSLWQCWRAVIPNCTFVCVSPENVVEHLISPTIFHIFHRNDKFHSLFSHRMAQSARRSISVSFSFLLSCRICLLLSLLLLIFSLSPSHIHKHTLSLSLFLSFCSFYQISILISIILGL